MSEDELPIDVFSDEDNSLSVPTVRRRYAGIDNPAQSIVGYAFLLITTLLAMTMIASWAVLILERIHPTLTLSTARRFGIPLFLGLTVALAVTSWRYRIAKREGP